MALQLPHLPDIERLSPRVIRIMGSNPSKFTLQGTNTYLIGTGSRRILIDTGEGNRIWPETLKKALKDEDVTVDKVILTHWHPDHVGGVKDVKALSSNVEIFKNRPDPGQKDIKDGQTFRTEGAVLRAFYCPGHAIDHHALILEEEDAMFTGDNVLGHGTAVFEDLATYMDSLQRMQHQFSGRAYPAHGAVIDDGEAKIKEYISHRKEREDQILAAMRQKPEGGAHGWSSMRIVKVVYKDYPENLHGPAEGGVVQVLKKLEGEGRVSNGGNGMWQIAQKSAL
jgi:ribonuclease/clavin/mitogillin